MNNEYNTQLFLEHMNETMKMIGTDYNGFSTLEFVITYNGKTIRIDNTPDNYESIYKLLGDQE